MILLITLTDSISSDKICGMTLAFLITTLVLFVLNLGLSLTVLAKEHAEDEISRSTALTIIVTLFIITFNIFAIVYR